MMYNYMILNFFCEFFVFESLAKYVVIIFKHTKLLSLLIMFYIKFKMYYLHQCMS
jgi:hypothetical protein